MPSCVVVLFGVGTDYIVFLLFRYREHLRQGASHQDALILSTRVVGRVVASSAITVIGAFAALFLARLGLLNSLAPGLIIAVALMLLTALTLIPALCAVLGKYLFWPLGPGTELDAVAVGPISRFVGHRPAIVVVIVAAGLIILTVFAPSYKSTYDTLDEMPSDTPSLEAYNTLSASLPPRRTEPHPGVRQDRRTGSARRIGHARDNLGKVPGVASVSEPQLSADGTAAVINVILIDGPYTSEALDIAEGPLRDKAAHSSIPNAEVLVGGESATLADVRSQLDSDSLRVFPVAVVIVGLILGLLLLSVLAPLNLLVCVGLTFGATLGAVVIVFLFAAGLDGRRLHDPDRALSVRGGHRHRLQHPADRTDPRRVPERPSACRGRPDRHRGQRTHGRRGRHHPRVDLRVPDPHRARQPPESSAPVWPSVYCWPHW